MAKIPQKPEEIFEEFTQDYQGVFRDDLTSIILYGSGARGEYTPKKSDLNFLIVLTEPAMDRLKEAFPLVHKWRKRRVNIPLFLTEAYIASSLDTFPVEFLNFRESHTLVFGKDVLAELSFDKESVRLQCERELKGKLLLLREAFLDSEGKTRELGQVSSASVTAFLSLFRALLFLRDKEIPQHIIINQLLLVGSKSLQLNLLRNGIFDDCFVQFVKYFACVLLTLTTYE